MMNQDPQHPPYCETHHKYHILSESCFIPKQPIKLEDEMKAKLVVAELAIAWAHATRDAEVKEMTWSSHGGPLRKKAADLEQEMRNAVFNNHLIPHEEAVENVEMDGQGRKS
jgi:hypothetical protein